MLCIDGLQSLALPLGRTTYCVASQMSFLVACGAGGWSVGFRQIPGFKPRNGSKRRNIMDLVASKSRLVSGRFATILFLLLLPCMGRAANLQVVCPGGGPGAYSSINAALSAIDPHGPNTITVSGTCVEN